MTSYGEAALELPERGFSRLRPFLRA